MIDLPLVDLKVQHREIADEVAAGFARVLETTSFILGREVEDFERAFAEFSGVRHCVGVGSGTDALELLLRGAGIGPGDEVLVPVNSFVASAFAVLRAGAVPAFVDCDPVYHLIDPKDAERRITERTRAVMPVHLYGQMAPMREILEIARGKRLLVLEDGAQSHGARQNGATPGSLGLGAATSFYPGKNLGAYGDAGAVLTDSEELASKVRALRNYGSERKYVHSEPGFNSRLDSLQAVVLSAKLKRLAAWNEARREAAARYDALLGGLPGLALPATRPGNLHVWHLYVVRVPERDRVLQDLNAAGIGAGVHYPVPMHMQEAFANLRNEPAEFPVALRAANEILSLPIFPGIGPRDQERVAGALRKALT
jgi:dTDP-4-amino-4,6-dideoxygalactose transaminase